MPDALTLARQHANRVRFSGDTLKPTDGEQRGRGGPSVRDSLYQDGLLISSFVTPNLAESLVTVCDRLGIPHNAIEAFVFSSSDLQAECYPESNSKCVLRCSSSLVDLLDKSEFEFVLGHEIGHFLFDHGYDQSADVKGSAEYKIARRAQEISVDRIGLLACGSLEAALRALTKTVSGLGDRHLRFDFSSILSQLEKISGDGAAAHTMSTHPSLLVRCRAVLWFSLSDYVSRGPQFYSSQKMTQLDRLVDADLRRFVNRDALKEIEEAKENFLLWSFASESLSRGSFSRRDQNILKELVGSELVLKLKEFIQSAPKSEIAEQVAQRLSGARAGLVTVLPFSWNREAEATNSEVSSLIN